MKNKMPKCYGTVPSPQEKVKNDCVCCVYESSCLVTDLTQRSEYLAPPHGYWKCACCGEETKIEPFKHDQYTRECQYDCWYIDDSNNKTIYNTMNLASWSGWKKDRRKK